MVRKNIVIWLYSYDVLFLLVYSNISQNENKNITKLPGVNKTYKENISLLLS